MEGWMQFKIWNNVAISHKLDGLNANKIEKTKIQ